MLSEAIIVDIDGTLALRGDRSPYDWKKVGDDSLNVPVFKLIDSLCEYRRILVSGRDEMCRGETERWLMKHGIWYTDLHMRKTMDQRKDSIVKQEIYEQHIKDKYEIAYVIDDRNQVVAMWRSLGLTCLQVAEGNF